MKGFKFVSAAILTLTAWGAWARGGAVHYDAQTRGIAVVASVTGFPRAGTSMTPRTDGQNSAVPAVGFTPFAASLSALGQLGAASPMAYATASQESVLGADGFNTAGVVQAGSVFASDGFGSATATSTFHVTFDVATAMSYVLTASLTGTIGATAPQVNLSFMGQADDALFASVSAAGAGNFTFAGTLEPGTYSVAFDAKAANDSSSSDALAYAITFQASDVVTATKTSSQTLPVSVTSDILVSVPAPPAVFTEAMTLASVLGVGYVRRRWARWLQAGLA